MTRPSRTLVGRALGYFAVRDLIPLYAVYSLLFQDHGLSMGQISSLLVIWSLTAFVTELPSGALADAVSRRGLLVLSSVLYAVGFSLWTAVPSYSAFAAGFVLWGVSGSLMSGTFEALLYDQLAAQRATESYPRLMGWANSLAMVAETLGTLLAAPLFALGGYALVGWASVGLAVLQALLALCLPGAPPVAEADETVEAVPVVHAGFAHRYTAMLRSGVHEVAAHRPLRHLVLIASLLGGVLAFDEYFTFVAREHGAATQTVPLLVGLVSGGQMIGAALAGRTARFTSRAIGWMLATAAVLIAVGASEGQWIGFLAIGTGYGLAINTLIVIEARVQDAITGPARSTVTSLSGVLSESLAVTVFAVFAVGTAWFTVTTLLVALSFAMAMVAALVRRWLPAPVDAAGSDAAEVA
ncbi:MAG: MFS transporter [Actinomycetota bacterium]|nr:MFS transporter [Actinomycetota bacterium]